MDKFTTEEREMKIGRFIEVCKRRRLKVKTDESKVMVLGEEEGSICKVFVVGTRLEYASEFMNSVHEFAESGTDGSEYRRKVASGGKV